MIVFNGFMWIFHLCYFKNFLFIKKDQRNFSPSAARPVNGGTSNRWGKDCSFSFLNHVYTEEDEKKHFKIIFFILFSVISSKKRKKYFVLHPLDARG
jgi:hypothetical protein